MNGLLLPGPSCQLPVAGSQCSMSPFRLLLTIGNLQPFGYRRWPPINSFRHHTGAPSTCLRTRIFQRTCHWVVRIRNSVIFQPCSFSESLPIGWVVHEPLLVRSSSPMLHATLIPNESIPPSQKHEVLDHTQHCNGVDHRRVARLVMKR